MRRDMRAFLSVAGPSRGRDPWLCVAASRRTCLFRGPLGAGPGVCLHPLIRPPVAASPDRGHSLDTCGRESRPVRPGATTMRPWRPARGTLSMSSSPTLRSPRRGAHRRPALPDGDPPKPVADHRHLAVVTIGGRRGLAGAAEDLQGRAPRSSWMSSRASTPPTPTTGAPAGHTPGADHLARGSRARARSSPARPGLAGRQGHGRGQPRGEHHRRHAPRTTPREGPARIANGVSRTFLARARRARTPADRAGRERLQAEADRLGQRPRRPPSSPPCVSASVSSASARAARARTCSWSLRRAPRRAQLAQALCATACSPSWPRSSWASWSRWRATSCPRASSTRASSAGPWICACWPGCPTSAGSRRRAAVMSGVEAEAYETVRAGVELVAGPPSRPAADPGHRRCARRGQDHGRLAAREHARPDGAQDPDHLRRSAGTPHARGRRGAAGPRAVGHPGHDRLGGEQPGPRDPGALDRQRGRRVLRTREQGRLDVITSGTKAKDPGRLVTAGAMSAFLAYVRTLDYDYVLRGRAAAAGHRRRPGPGPLRGPDDPGPPPGPPLLDNVADLRQLLDRMEVTPLGLIVIGAKAEISPYYTTRRTAGVEVAGR